MDNLKFYEMGRAVPKEAQKAFNNGSFSGTDINPMWRIKKLTEMFGPAGIGWYTEILSERCEEHADAVIAVVNINLYVKVDGEWSKPIYGTGGNVIIRKEGAKVSDEGYKMAYTDALSVACKALGIGADVYFEKDKTKYTETEAAPAKAPAKAAPTKKTETKAAGASPRPTEADDASLTPMRERVKSIYRGDVQTELLNKYNVLAVADLTREQLETILTNYDAWVARQKEARGA